MEADIKNWYMDMSDPHDPQNSNFRSLPTAWWFSTVSSLVHPSYK